MTENTVQAKTRLELIVELIRALAWPSFAFVLLIALWSPLRLVALQLPDLIGRSETISIAGLSIKVGKGLRQQASKKVVAVLAKLSPDGLRKLVDRGNESYWDIGSESFAKTENAELVRLKLLEEIPERELKERNQRYGYGIRPTSLGKEAREYVLALLAEFVGEIRKTR